MPKCRKFGGRLFLVVVVSLAIVLAGSPQAKTDAVPSNFPVSAWEKQKEVTQIPWFFDVSKPSIRFDLRQELSLAGWIRGDGLTKADKDHSFDLYVRALERGQPASSVHSKPLYFPAAASSMATFSVKAIVRSGKYRVEVALIDRASGRYNIKFENVTIEDDENPVEGAFQSFGKFEFVPETPRDPFPPNPSILIAERISLRAGGPASLKGSSLGFTEDRPSFVVDRHGTTQVSVITILTPPENVVENPGFVELFRENLSNLLSVITRLEVRNGTATLTAVDLEERTRVFDQIDLKDFTAEMLDRALKKDTRTISLDALAGRIDQGTFFRDVLKERLTAAERDVSGAQHAILVVSANSKFPNSSGLTVPRARDCHCQVFYLRFAMVPNGPDDIDDILKAYKPQVFEPLTWQDFREDFGKIYGQLLR